MISRRRPLPFGATAPREHGSRNTGRRASTFFITAPCASMAAKVTPSLPGAPSLLWASAYASRSVSILQTWTYNPQNRQVVSVFALAYILRLRSLQIHGRLYHLVLAFLIARETTNSRAPSLRGHCSASSLIRTHPPLSRLRSISRLSRLYDLPCSGNFSPGRGGLLQLLGMSLPPCCRFHPAEVKMPHRSDFGTPCCLRPTVASSALGSTHSRGHIRVHFHYGPVARDLPEGDLVDRLQSLGFPPLCYPNYGAPDSYPGRFISC